MPQYDYRAYAASPAGKAARAKARARWVAKRKAEREMKSAEFDYAPLLRAVNKWSQPCK